MKPQLFIPEPDETPTRPTAIRGAHGALALIAMAGIGVTLFAALSENQRSIAASLASERVAAFSTGLLYMLAATMIHSLICFDLGRKRQICRRAARGLLAAHGLVALAVLYSFAVQRLTSRALLVGLDALLSSTAILGVLACVVGLAMVTQRESPQQDETFCGLRRTRIFCGVSVLYAASILWLEWSPLP